MYRAVRISSETSVIRWEGPGHVWIFREAPCKWNIENKEQSSVQLSPSVHESAVSLVLRRNHEFYGLFTRELMKKKSRTEAYIVVGKRLLFRVYSMMKNSRPYRERIPGISDRGRGSLPVQ